MRRFPGLVATIATLVALVAAAAAPGAEATAGTAPGVRTLLGPAVVDAPGGIALDAAGDLFVADTGHCRVLEVPSRAGTG